MKLTNLSLAILVALGVAACGGSDSNDKQTVDPGNGGNGGSTTTTTTTPTDTSGSNDTSALDPTRIAPDMTVQKDIADLVATRKREFINRGFADSALGYTDSSGLIYDSTAGTDAEDLKYKSIYNFSAEGDLITSDGKGSAVNGYKPSSIGAIHVGGEPDAKSNNAYVKGADGRYYRVKAKVDKNLYTPSTKFEIVSSKVVDQQGFGAGFDDISQSKVVFIANANSSSNNSGLVIDLGKDTNNSYILAADPKQKEVILNTVSLLGENYKADTLGQNIDFSKLPLKKAIQEEEIKGAYSIINTKETGTNDDDKTVDRTAVLGYMKAYNLPYSIAFVTTNADKSAEKNIFNLDTGTFTNSGAFQVNGFESLALPKEGRAIYTGKSFNATTEGDIKLVADFFTDRSHISGSILNRRNSSNVQLPDLTLQPITLTTPTTHSVFGTGDVTGQPNYADKWTATFYGTEAQEVAGELFDSTSKRVKEVYGAQRGVLTNESNNSSVK